MTLLLDPPDRADEHSAERGAVELALNDIGRVRLRLHPEVMALPYEVHHEAGRLILVDEATNTTAGAVMVRSTVAGDGSLQQA